MIKLISILEIKNFSSISSEQIKSLWKELEERLAHNHQGPERVFLLQLLHRVLDKYWNMKDHIQSRPDKPETYDKLLQDLNKEQLKNLYSDLQSIKNKF